MKKMIFTIIFFSLLVVSAYAEGIWVTYNTETCNIVDNYVSEIAFDNNGILWYATERIIGSFDGMNWNYYTFIKDSLRVYFVTELFVDSDNILWVGCAKEWTPEEIPERGLLSFDGTKWKIHTYPEGPEGAISSIAEDKKNGILWFASRNYGAYSFDGTIWKKYTCPLNLDSIDERPWNVRNVAVDYDGVKWFGTSFHGVTRFDGTTWTVYSTQDGLASNEVLAIAVDIDETLWASTHGEQNGMSHFNGSTWTTYTRRFRTITTNSPKIYDIAVDPWGVKWFTTGEGVISFVTKGVINYYGNKTTLYTEEDGLAGNNTRKIAIGADGSKWFTTNYGLSRFIDRSISVETKSDTPKTIELWNHPNPFNPSTTISCTLPKSSHVRLAIYNINGQEITSLVSDLLEAGGYGITWNASDCASGVYFCRLEIGEVVKTVKMLLMR